MSFDQIRRTFPNLLALTGCALFIAAFVEGGQYQNIITATGILFLFLAWIEANLQKGLLKMDENEWRERKKVLFAMSAVTISGFAMLFYYEMHVPKYHIAITKKTLYHIPPHLDRHELIELGRDCNTYGNTRCSHDVFARVLKKDPRDYKALANLAMAQTHLGYHKMAIQNFKKALDAGVIAYDIYKFYGHSLKATKNYSAAVVAYKRSLELNPNQNSLKMSIDSLKASQTETSVKLSQ